VFYHIDKQMKASILNGLANFMSLDNML
jgi:hypothetical protein